VLEHGLQRSRCSGQRLSHTVPRGEQGLSGLGDEPMSFYTLRLALLATVGTAIVSPLAAETQGWRAVTVKSAPVNTEVAKAGPSRAPASCAPTLTKDLPFSISVDGKRVGSNDVSSNVDSQRCADVALHAADIQIRYDGLQNEARLNVLVGPDAANKGDNVVFATDANYLLRIAHGEIRLFTKDRTVRQEPLVIVPVERGGARWSVPKDLQGDLTYVLRVYDEQGRFDETAPKTLSVADVRGGKLNPQDLLAVYDGNARSVRNIPISGGSVLVSGRRIAPGDQVYVMGLPVPVDSKGDFAFRQLLPAGPNQVDVSIVDPKGAVAEFSRSAVVPDHDFFYVALADLTAGRGSSSGAIDLLRTDKADEFNKQYFVNGRLAFYLKGKVKGDTLLTASADTLDQPIKQMFSNFDSKDPRYLLRQLDPNRYYPVYGDDSTTVDDAPTRGKFYVKLERGDSDIVWGNFKTSINGTEFVRYDRGLYGARARVVSDDSTKFGERRGKVEAFAAEPGTIGARDVFRGTGGSLYYLSRQNITQGSERIVVEVRDKDTGLVIKTRTLVPVTDYEMNYLQGRIVLRSPLASTGADDYIVQTGSLSGHDQFIIANFEYTPGLNASMDRVTGGRGSYWVNDNVQVGVSGYDQTQPGQKQQLLGADVTVRYAPGTYVKLEGARSDGPGNGENVSADGGFTFSSRATNDRIAYAKRIEAAVDVNDFAPGKDGRFAFYRQEKDRDFSGPGQLSVTRASREMGVSGVAKLNSDYAVRGKVVEKQDEFRTYRAGEVNVIRTFNDYWKATVGGRLDDNNPQALSNSSTLNQRGRRTDLALKLDYDSHKDWSTYVFGQATVDKTGDRRDNNRIGIGGAARVSEKMTVLGEVSTGNGGIGGKVGSEYQIAENKTAYLSYALDPDRTDIISRGGQGILTNGTRMRFLDNVSVFGEERVRHGGGFSGLTHAFGLDFVPFINWKTGLSFETGDLHDPLSGDIARNAVGLTLGYSNGGLTYSGKLEYRDDEADRLGVKTARETWLTTNTLGMKVSPDWRYVGRFNGSVSTSSQGDFYRGDFVEGVTGFAYRPVDNDKFNALFKYTFFYDLPAADQKSPAGVLASYAQKSHVLSADGAYDLVQWLSVGVKYAYRFGELRDNRIAGTWFDSQASLLIGRVDLHLVKEWDFIAEARLLQSETAKDSRVGALIGVYRHLGDNFKVGVGYNFTDYSDDLTNLNYNHSGVFVNALGKF
jgi:hypothetical protein